MPGKNKQNRERGIREVGEHGREGLRTSERDNLGSREEGPGRVPGLDGNVPDGERGTQSDDSFVSRETERVSGAPRQEPRRPGSLDRGRTASPRRNLDRGRDRSGEQGVSQRISRGAHQREESGLEEETSL
jgi:hypothetical protein